MAIKILPRELTTSDSTFVERFKREAKTMARLSHPAIIAVHEAGETPDGLLFFVMDYVEGTDVFQMLREQGRLKSKHALLITAHLCDALQYAHSQGVMHRNIKPANIMVDAAGYVRVADFGLAKSLQRDAGLTMADVSVGTPDYAAPEVTTLGMTPDHRADLYSVGVLLYQMLTGVVPKGNFKQPSELVSGLDSRFDAVVLRAMEPNPPQRFQSAAEVRQALDEIMASPAIQSGGQSTPAIPKRAMRPGWLWPVIGAAAAVVMIGTAAFVAKGLRPSGGENVAMSESSPKPEAAYPAKAGSSKSLRPEEAQERPQALPLAEAPATPVAKRLPASGGETVAPPATNPKPEAASLPLAGRNPCLFMREPSSSEGFLQVDWRVLGQVFAR